METRNPPVSHFKRYFTQLDQLIKLWVGQNLQGQKRTLDDTKRALVGVVINHQILGGGGPVWTEQDTR